MTRYGFVIDQDRCIGCHACTVACKTEHQVPLGVNRTWVKYIEKGAWPDTRRFFTVLRCNHCTDAPCVAICPTKALHKRPDGIVDFDTDRCIGCKSCMQGCPYDALYIDPGEHTAQKCNYCVHRVEVGLEPACVIVCPEQAIIAGDLEDPTTRIASLVATEQVFVRTPEQGTRPNLFYKGVEQAGIDPLIPVQTAGSMIWRDDPSPPPPWMSVDLSPRVEEHGPSSVHHGNGRIPPRVVYTTDHPAPWGWKVSSYFLTKGIAAGMAIVMALALLLGAPVDNPLARWVTPLVAGLFLAATGVLLVWDLKRPDRFLYLLTKSNPGSWLVRGAWVLSAYAAVLGTWFLAGVFGADGLVEAMTIVGAVLGIATAGYTAFLFGQAEGRDLWQSPTLLWHMLAGAFAAGGGAVMIAATVLEVPETAVSAARWSLVGGAIALGLIGAVEMTSRHPTRNMAAAMHHLTSGAFRSEWWAGFALAVFAAAGLGLAAGPVGTWAGALGGAAAAGLGLAAGPAGTWAGALGGAAAFAGIWLMDDAFVKAGQSVPLS